MAFSDLLLFAGVAGVVYYLFRPKKKAETTQELMDYVDISEDGIIELPGQKYRLVIEVEPINIALRSLQEQAAIWLGFKNLANAINLPTTLLIQTRYLNLKEYLDWLRTMNQKRTGSIRKYAEEHSDYLIRKTEGKNTRDRRNFIIIKIDAASTGIESGIEVDNPMLGTLINSVPKISKAKASSEELKETARSELMEAASVTRSLLEAIGIRSDILHRKAVIDFLYHTFNRDLAPFSRLEEADTQNMFSLFTTSSTPKKVLTWLKTG